MAKVSKILGLGLIGSGMAFAAPLVDAAAFADVKTDITTAGSAMLGIALVALSAGLIFKFIWSKK